MNSLLSSLSDHVLSCWTAKTANTTNGLGFAVYWFSTIIPAADVSQTLILSNKLHIQGFSLQYKHPCVELKIIDFSDWCRRTRPNRGLSLSLSCPVEMGRREPWERGCRFSFTLQALRVISIKILLVISMLYETDWWWELWRWSHKIQWVDTLTITCCDCFYRKHNYRDIKWEFEFWY